MKMSSKPVVYVLTNLKGDLLRCLQNVQPTTKFISLPCSGPSLSAEVLTELRNEAETIVADPPVLAQLLYVLPRCKWAQVTYAGVDAIMKAKDQSKPAPNFTITRFGGVFGVPMAEYVLAQMIARERKFTMMDELQRRHKWDQGAVCMYRPLSKLSITLLGLGDIGCVVARQCKSFGMTVRALVRRIPEPADRHPYIDEYRDVCHLREGISDCDYLCSVLPATPSTNNILDGDVLQACKQRQTVLINVGRGNILQEETIVRAIKEKWIGGAILDVFNTEPLPEDHELWGLEGVTISPHTATQSFDWQIAEVFKANYEKYVRGESLDYTVDWDKGY